jgi:hypothetical protein
MSETPGYVKNETVSTMINSGRSDELVAAHSQLYETLKSHDLNNVEEIVRVSYFGDTIHGAEKVD